VDELIGGEELEKARVPRRGAQVAHDCGRHGAAKAKGDALKLEQAAHAAVVAVHRQQQGGRHDGAVEPRLAALKGADVRPASREREAIKRMRWVREVRRDGLAPGSSGR